MTLITNSELKMWHRILPLCKIVFDVGVRNDTNIMELYPDVTFHVFEPNPASYRSLLTKIRHLPNVIANNFGLGNTNSKLLYYSDTESIVCRTHHTKSTAVPYEIDIVRLDDYCTENGVEHIDFLKIDVEGFELEVMKGAENMIRRSCPYIQFEYGGTFLDADIRLGDIYSFLNGWKFYRITETGVEYMPLVQEDYVFCNYIAVNEKAKSHDIPIDSEIVGNEGTGQYTDDNRLEFEHVKLPTGSIQPHFLQKISRLFGLTTYIDTDVCIDDTSPDVSDAFEVTWLIHQGPELHNDSEKTFYGLKSKILCGSPVCCFPEIFARSNKNILIRLTCNEDYDPGTPRNTRLMEEVKAISDAKPDNCVILIDNIRFFDRAWNRDTDAGPDQSDITTLCTALREIDNAFSFALCADILMAFRHRDTITMSPTLIACTASRLFEADGEAEEIINSEQAITNATDTEMTLLYALCTQYADSEYHGFGRHYRLWYALALMGQIKYMQACKEFRTAIILGMDHWRVYWYLAKTAYEAGYFSLAKEAIGTVCNVVPEFEDGRRLHQLLKETKNETTKEKGFSLQDRLELAIHLVNSGKEYEAFSGLEKTPIHCENRTEMYREYAGLLLRLGKNDAAIELLSRAARNDPGNSSLDNDIGVGYFQKGDYGKAMEHFAQALSDDDRNYQVLQNIVFLSYKLGTITEVSAVLEGLLKKYPADQVLFNIAQEFVNLVNTGSMQRKFEEFVNNIHPLTIKRHDEILKWAEDREKNAFQYEDRLRYEESENEIVRNGYSLCQEVKLNYKNKYTCLSGLRILIHIPPLNVSPGGYSLFTNMFQALSYIGISTRALGWDEPVEHALNDFRPSVLMTSDHTLYLSRINWDKVREYQNVTGLRIGLTASLEEYGNTPLAGRLHWAKQHNVDFFYSFRSPEYLNRRREYLPFFDSGYKIFSIEFAANPLIHYPVPDIKTDLDYIFLGSSNGDKWSRYFEYLSGIISRHTGFLDGPGWGFQVQTSNLNKDRYLYARSRIGLNLHLTEQIQWPCELNERTYILAACGVPQLIDGAQLLPRRFDENGFFVAESPEQYSKNFDLMLKDPDEANRRAIIAQKEVFSFHTWFHRAERLSLDLAREFFSGNEHGLVYGTKLFDEVNSQISGKIARVGGALRQLLTYEGCDVEDINLLDGGFGAADESSMILDMHEAYRDIQLRGRYDCIVSSNVIEHSFNPIFLLLNFYLVTRKGGYQFHAIPNYRYTYDVYRKPTAIEHFLRDFEGMADRNDPSHVGDYTQSAVEKHGWQREFHKKYPIGYPYMHFHVFDEHNTRELLEYMFQDVMVDLIRTRDFSDNVVLFRNELNPVFAAKYGHVIDKYSKLFLLHSESARPRRREIKTDGPDAPGGTATNGSRPVTKVIAIVFSKDRSMQLDCLLSTFYKHCRDADDVYVNVLYAASSDRHQARYAVLADRFSTVNFVPEHNFKDDLIALLRSSQYVLFAVDDNIFVNDFSVRHIVECLDRDDGALGFSLRLGVNTTYCYMLNRFQVSPKFTASDTGTLAYEWPSAECDFGYPLELSSSVYRINDVLPILASGNFSNPNTLEAFLDARKSEFITSKKTLLCFRTSVSFCSPLNMVQATYANRAGGNPLYSPDKLAELYTAGYRIDIEPFSGFVSNSCHQEVELQFIDGSGNKAGASTGAPTASIVVLSFNGIDHIRACIDSIRRNTVEEYEIIVVDNARQDGSREYLKSLDDIVLIENDENRGPAVARAQAMSVARGEYIAFLDDDTIVSHEWLTKFIAITRARPDIGMIGAVSNYASGHQLVPGARYDNIDEFEEFARKHYEDNKGRLTLTHRLISFCLFITRAVANKIGTFDGRFGLFGFEDDDYSLRAYIAGLKPCVAHEIFIHHTGGPQGRGNEAYNARLQEAWRIFKDKWGIPKDVPYGGSFDIETISNQQFDENRHYVPIPSNGIEEIEINIVFARARESAGRGDLDNAIAIFCDHLTGRPDSGIVYAALGTLYRGKGEYEKARDALKRAIELMPSEVTTYLQLAELHSLMNETDKAVEVFETVLTREPSHIEAMAGLVDTLVNSGRLAEAVEKVKNALLEDPGNPDMIAIFGHLAAVSRNPDALETCIGKLTDIDPSHSAVPKLQAIHAEIKGRHDSSRDPVREQSENSVLTLTFIKTADFSLDPAFLTIMRDLCDSHVFVETGTFAGSTALAASRVFREVHTVELDETLFDRACDRLKNISNVKVHRGDSGEVLPGILQNITGPILFWLDGHYSGDETARSGKDTPILEEIRAIARSGITDSTIMIDDIRLFPTAGADGETDYPSLTEVCNEISAIDENYRFVVYGDILIAYHGTDQVFSPVVSACTATRFYDDGVLDEHTVFKAEDIIRQACGDELQAINTYHAVFRSGAPGCGYLRLWKALTCMGDGKYSETIDEIEAAIGQGFYRPRLSIYLAEAYLQTGRPEAAAQHVDKALHEQPHSIYAQKMREIINGSIPAAPEASPATRFHEDAGQYTHLLEKTEKRFVINPSDIMCIDERTPSLDFDPHYMLHTSWAARVLAETRPVKHVDISSSLYFATIASAFVPIEFYDYRPAPISLSGLNSQAADATKLPFPDNSIDSLSCMHVVEHIGLGRYGDPIDPDGDLKAINELKRVVTPGGQLLFVVPMGRPRLVFNAHRIYSYDQIAGYFDGFSIEQFRLIPDQAEGGNWTLLDGTRELADRQTYGCGCFVFKKRKIDRESAVQGTKTSQSDPYVKKRSLSVIIPAPHLNQSLVQCLKFLTINTEQICETIIVTKKPSKIPAWLKKAAKDKTRIISMHKQANFSHMCNEALKNTTGEYVLILDQGTVIQDGTIRKMMHYLTTNDHLAMVVPMANHAAGIQEIPGTRDMSLAEFEDFTGPFGERNAYRFVEAFEIDTFCILMKKQAVANIGPFDENISNRFFTLNDYRIRGLLHEYSAGVATDAAVYRIDPDDAQKSRDEVFQSKWANPDPGTPSGKTLLVSGTLKNAMDLYGKGLLQESISAIMDGIRYAPENSSLYYCLSRILLSAKMFDQAREALDSLSDHERNTAHARDILAYCNFYLDNLEAAREYNDSVLALSPDSASALTLKGLLIGRLGDRHGAGTLFRQAILANPGLAEPYMHIGVMKWQDEDARHEALEYIERAFILSPDNEDFSTTYHTAIRSAGNLERGETVVREALRLYPKNKKLVFLHTALLLEQDKYDDAMKHIEKTILDFGIDDELLQAALSVRDRIGARIIDDRAGTAGTLSICMIVKNEEKFILKCLESIKPVADEIIVVDTGSTDRTRDICRIFGARVYDYPWTENFSEARNVSLEKAQGEWVLVHDADEVLSPRDHDSLKQLIRKNSSQPVAYDIITRNYIIEPATDGWVPNTVREYAEEEQGTGWFPSNKVRLFTRDPRICFSNPVHEILEPSIMQAGIEIKKCTIPIHHYGKLPSEKGKAKGNSYYELGKKKLELAGNTPMALRELAVQAEELGRHDEAIDHWCAYSRIKPDLALPHFNMASIYLEMGQFENAFSAAKKAYEIDPVSKETVLTYAAASLCAGDEYEAVDRLKNLLAKVDNYPPAQAALIAAYCITGQAQDGISLMKSMKEKGYNYDPAFHSLAKKLKLAGKTEQSIALLESVITWNNRDPDTVSLLNECREGQAV